MVRIAPHRFKHMVVGPPQHRPVHHGRIRHGEEIGTDLPCVGQERLHVVYIIFRRRESLGKCRRPRHPGHRIRHIQMGMGIKHLFRNKIL